MAIDPLTGADFEGGEAWCDDVVNAIKNHFYGATAPTAPADGLIWIDSDDGRTYLRHASAWYEIFSENSDVTYQNLLINSGFGVWSLSDANKGLATVVVDSGSTVPTVGETVTGATSGATGKIIYMDNSGGDWGTGTGTGDIHLGAVTGTFQDNENLDGSVSGANFATVNGDTAIGICNDPMNNDSTGNWTDDGANITLAFAAAEYTVTTNAANQRAWIAFCSVEAGKLYKIELDIKDGTQAGVVVQGYFNDGAAQYGRSATTAAGWASVSWTFECVTTFAAALIGFRVVDNCGGNNIEVRRFSCYEITPCCTEADVYACDLWNKSNTFDLYRQHNDGGTFTKDGSFYSLMMVNTVDGDLLYYPKALWNNLEWSQQFANRTITLGCWVKTSTASHARLAYYDGAWKYSDYHTGGGAWEWLEVTVSLGAAIIVCAPFGFEAAAAPNIDGSTIIYASQPTLIFGSAIGEGNYSPRQHEFIWLERYIAGQELDFLFNLSDSGWTNLNLEADADGMLPKGAKAVHVYSMTRDSASAANDCYLQLRADATRDYCYHGSPGGLGNDIYARVAGRQPCDIDGDFDYNIDASGAGTFDIYHFRYLGVQLTN